MLATGRTFYARYHFYPRAHLQQVVSHADERTQLKVYYIGYLSSICFQEAESTTD